MSKKHPLATPPEPPDGPRWREEIIGRYERLRGDLVRFDGTEDAGALMFILREAAELLRMIADNDELWSWIDEAIAGNLEEAVPERLGEVLGDLDHIVEIERELLMQAGMSPESANDLVDATRLTVERYAMMRFEGTTPNSEQLRPGFRNLADAAEETEAAIAKAISRPATEPSERKGLLKRGFGIAVRALNGIGGVGQIVVDVAFAHTTFGVTLVSVVSGAAQAGSAASGD